jgi:hypothetical protein
MRRVHPLFPKLAQHVRRYLAFDALHYLRRIKVTLGALSKMADVGSDVSSCHTSEGGRFES